MGAASSWEFCLAAGWRPSSTSTAKNVSICLLGRNGAIEIFTDSRSRSSLLCPHDVDRYEGGDRCREAECYRDSRVGGNWRHISTNCDPVLAKKRPRVKSLTHDVVYYDPMNKYLVWRSQ